MNDKTNEGKENSMNTNGWKKFLVNWQPVTLYILILGCIMTGGNFMFMDKYKESSNLYMTANTLTFLLITFYMKPIIK